MIKINKILNSVTFKRILVFFVVGLVSRSVVNYVYDINVLKEYTNMIFIICPGFMTYFVYDLPIISLNVLDLKLIRSAIKVYCENYYFSGKFDAEMFISNMNYEKIYIF
jgi:hypothetical protein